MVRDDRTMGNRPHHRIPQRDVQEALDQDAGVAPGEHAARGDPRCRRRGVIFGSGNAVGADTTETAMKS